MIFIMQSNKIITFNDADYTGNTEIRKSTISFVLKLSDSAIAWLTQQWFFSIIDTDRKVKRDMDEKLDQWSNYT